MVDVSYFALAVAAVFIYSGCAKEASANNAPAGPPKEALRLARQRFLYTLHTPPRAIGELAQDAAVHSPLLSHISPAVEENRDAVFESIKCNYQGPVSFAADGTRVRP